jgi:hypothetical protein
MALSAGVLVSLATFLLSKNATLLFQHEARISAAQLSLTIGLNRLTADIQRASFLSSMNPKLDPRVCKDSSWAGGMNGLAGITIAQHSQGTWPTPQSVANGIQPDQIWIGGSLDTDDMFEVQSVQSGTGSAPLLVFRTAVTEPATMRALANLAPGVNLQSSLQCNFFQPPSPCTLTKGRYAQIYDPIRDFHYYGLIKTLIVDGSNNVSVQLDTTINVPLKANTYCGVASYNTPGVRWLMSVVSQVTYDIRSIAGAAPYTALVSTSLNTPAGAQADMAGITGDSGRTELVRVELDPVSGLEVPSTLEVISEYAVDLRFGITSQTHMTTGNVFMPTMTTIPIANPTSGTVYSTPPESIRSVQVRLATRARAPDRVSPMPAVPTTDGRLLHFGGLALGCPPPGSAPVAGMTTECYARVRTAYANVTLPNQGGFWQW